MNKSFRNTAEVSAGSVSLPCALEGGEHPVAFMEFVEGSLQAAEDFV